MQRVPVAASVLADVDAAALVAAHVGCTVEQVKCGRLSGYEPGNCRPEETKRFILREKPVAEIVNTVQVSTVKLDVRTLLGQRLRCCPTITVIVCQSPRVERRSRGEGSKYLVFIECKDILPTCARFREGSTPR